MEDLTDLSTLPTRFALLASKTPDDAIQWRPQTTPKPGQSALHIPFIKASYVRALLDSVFPAAWETSCTLPISGADEDGVVVQVVKTRLTISGVSRESIGVGKDAKAADSDSLKRAAARFGIGADLARYERNYVPYGSDPAENYKLILARKAVNAPPPAATYGEPYEAPGATRIPTPPPRAASSNMPIERKCPNCASYRMWDNTSPRAGGKPHYKCAKCGERVYVDEPAAAAPGAPVRRTTSTAAARQGVDDGFRATLTAGDDQDELPF